MARDRAGSSASLRPEGPAFISHVRDGVDQKTSAEGAEQSLAQRKYRPSGPQVIMGAFFHALTGMATEYRTVRA